MYTHNGNYLEGTLRTATIKRQSSWDCRADGWTDLYWKTLQLWTQMRMRMNNEQTTLSTVTNLMRDGPFNIINGIERTKRFGSQNCVDCNGSKGTVCILMHSLYELTGTGAAFRSKPHFIPYMYSCKSDLDHEKLVMTIQTYNYGRH